ncbi:hypothetical protein ACFC1R_19415 [Kitasatospora sp. NPDC056138]|uniref:hypothetical protein n=1 Tax=Kitasatospora sp. NPDC056138 TaxID=3345724 RepID=UPI0035D85E4E
MPTVSVVTVVPDGGHHRLPEAYRSLAAQQLPTGWEWQWVVEGVRNLAEAGLPDDRRVSPGTGPKTAPASPNGALARATGTLLRTLDADGLLPQGALRRDVEIMTGHPELGWCLSPGLDLLPDETLAAGPDGPPAGPIRPGVLADGLRAGRLPALGTTLTARTDLLRALGGWPDPAGTAGLGLLLACEAVAQGWMLGEPGTIRCTDHHVPLTEETVAAALGRVDALRRSGWRWQSPPTLSRFERQLGQSSDPQWSYDRRMEIHSAVNSVLHEADDLVKRRARNGCWTPPGEISEGGSNVGLATAARVWVLDRLAARIDTARAVLDQVEHDCRTHRETCRETCGHTGGDARPAPAREGAEPAPAQVAQARA